MLEINLLRTQPDLVKEKLRVKNFAQVDLVDEVLALDEKWRQTKTTLNDIQSQSNILAKAIGSLFKEGKREEAEVKKAESSSLKEQSKTLSEEMDVTWKSLNDKLLLLPNLPHDSVAVGNSEEDNEVVFEEGVIPELPDDAKPHWELAEQYGLFSLELGTKITGAGFPVFTGKGARFQRALISYFLDQASDAGYMEVIPPLIVNEDSAYATTQLPDKEGQMYHITNEDFYLIPTAEVPLTNIYRNEIVKEADFPIKLVGFTPCFRREAGSYGAHVRGLNRVHQFDKVEIVQIQHPDRSYATLDEMVDHVKSLMNALNLPYRILRLCGGDASFASAMTYDFEVYSAAQKRWLEVSSVSNFETFQSNRMKLRFKDEDGKSHLAHTLNGSALALARIVAALIENNQTPEGIVVPEVLRPYTRFDIMN